MRTSGKRVLAYAVVGALCATAALAIAILLFSEFHRTQGRILGTTALIALGGLLALPAAILLDQGRARRLARAHIALTLTDCVLLLAAIWTTDPPPALGKTIATVTAFTLASVQATALTARRSDRDSRSVQRLYAASLALAVVIALLIAIAAWAEIDRELYYRVLGAFVVGDLLAIALQPVLAGSVRARAVHRMRLLVDPGGERLVEVEAATFASAVARAVAAAETNGARVRWIMRIDVGDASRTDLQVTSSRPARLRARS